MKNSDSIKLALVALLSALPCFSGNLLAQEKGQDAAPQSIEIVDENGKPAAIAIAPDNPGDVDAPIRARDKRVPAGNFGPGVQFRMEMPENREKGKLTVIGEDGKEQVIDISDARGVSISTSSSTVVVDGETKTETVRKAIIVDADGEKRSYDLPASAQMPGLVMRRMVLPGVGAFNVPNPESVNKFLIGVACSPVPEALAAQMKLATGQGLLVDLVSPGSPAGKAGLQRLDVLLYADDTELKSLDDLVRVVEESGSAGRALSLTFLREGKEMGVEVVPTKGIAGEAVGIPFDPVPPNVREMMQDFENRGLRIELETFQNLIEVE